MSDVYQPAYLQDDPALADYNNPNLTMRQRVGLDDDTGKPIAPSVEVAPSGRLRVTVSPPKNYQPAYLNPDQPAFTSSPKPQIGTGQAGVLGVIEGLSFGANPALVGLQKAGEVNPAAIKMPAGVPSEAPGLETIGAGLQGVLAGDPAVKEAYEKGRAEAANYANLASEQHRAAYLTGLLGSAVILPTMSAGAGATIGERAVSGALAGGVYGGAYGGGSAVGAGASPAETAAQAATGAVLGAGGGAVIPPIAAGASKVAGAVSGGVGAVLGHPIQTIQAARNINETAAQKVGAALRSDIETGSAPASSEIGAAQAAGQTPAIIDVGGTATRELAHSAANTSPEARSALETMTGERFKGQVQRVSDFVRGLVPGGGNAVRTQEAIDQAARDVNAPAYRRAFAAASKLKTPLWDDDLENLVQAPEVQSAIRIANVQAKNWAVKDGLAPPVGAFIIKDGKTALRETPNGNTIMPSLQLWDYVKRALDAQGTPTAKAFAKALRDNMDAQVPEYGEARAGAAAFFGAGNALEAGQKFVAMRGSLEEARQAINKMSMPERALFAEGFVSNLADKVSKIADNRSVTIDKIFNSVDGRERINLALGPNRSDQLESFLRREDMLDLARKGLQGSTTARQQFMRALAGGIGHGAAGGAMAGGVAAGAEQFFEGEIDAKKVLSAALLGTAAAGKVVISRQLAQRVGELLASNNPADIQLVTRMAANNPAVRDGIRRGEILLEKLAGQGAGHAPPMLPSMIGARADQQQQ